MQKDKDTVISVKAKAATMLCTMIVTMVSLHKACLFFREDCFRTTGHWSPGKSDVKLSKQKNILLHACQGGSTNVLYICILE